MPVLNRLRRNRDDADANEPRSRAMVAPWPAMRPWPRVRDLADLTLERGDRRGVDDHPPLAVSGSLSFITHAC